MNVKSYLKNVNYDLIYVHKNLKQLKFILKHYNFDLKFF